MRIQMRNTLMGTLGITYIVFVLVELCFFPLANQRTVQIGIFNTRSILAMCTKRR